MERKSSSMMSGLGKNFSMWFPYYLIDGVVRAKRRPAAFADAKKRIDASGKNTQ